MNEREKAIMTAYTTIKLQNNDKYLLDYLSDIAGRVVIRSEMNDVIRKYKKRIQLDYQHLSKSYEEVYMGGCE